MEECVAESEPSSPQSFLPEFRPRLRESSFSSIEYSNWFWAKFDSEYGLSSWFLGLCLGGSFLLRILSAWEIYLTHCLKLLKKPRSALPCGYGFVRPCDWRDGLQNSIWSFFPNLAILTVEEGKWGNGEEKGKGKYERFATAVYEFRWGKWERIVKPVWNWEGPWRGCWCYGNLDWKSFLMSHMLWN